MIRFSPEFYQALTTYRADTLVQPGWRPSSLSDEELNREIAFNRWLIGAINVASTFPAEGGSAIAQGMAKGGRMKTVIGLALTALAEGMKAVSKQKVKELVEICDRRRARGRQSR